MSRITNGTLIVELSLGVGNFIKERFCFCISPLCSFVTLYMGLIFFWNSWLHKTYKWSALSALLTWQCISVLFSKKKICCIFSSKRKEKGWEFCLPRYEFFSSKRIQKYRVGGQDWMKITVGCWTRTSGNSLDFFVRLPTTASNGFAFILII